MAHSYKTQTSLEELCESYETKISNSHENIFDHYNIPVENLFMDEDGNCDTNNKDFFCRDYFCECLFRAIDGEITFDELHEVLTNWDS